MTFVYVVTMIHLWSLFECCLPSNSYSDNNNNKDSNSNMDNEYDLHYLRG